MVISICGPFHDFVFLIGHCGKRIGTENYPFRFSSSGLTTLNIFCAWLVFARAFWREPFARFDS